MNEGLTDAQVNERLAEFGKNTLVEKQSSSFITKLVRELSNFLIILLIAAAVLSFFIGEYVDGWLILSIIIVNAIFGVYQEYKAEEAIRSLKNMAKSQVRVFRNGKEIQIDSSLLVPDDVIFVEEGTKVPADAVIIQTSHLELNEASLTGESVPVEKKRNETIYMGTIIARGNAVAKVTATGMNTEFGKIAEELTSSDLTQTPLQKKISHLSEVLGILGILLSLAVFALSMYQGNGNFPSFLLAVSLAVAVVPESLPAVMTVILSIGVKKMAAQNAIVRKLSAIEGLGNVTLIATDKTGTLTQNDMRVEEIWAQGHVYAKKSGQLPRIQSKSFEMLLLNGVLNSTASLVLQHTEHSKEPQYHVLGDPTEGALLYLAKDFEYDFEQLRKDWEVVDEDPFSSETKRMTTVVKNLSELYTFTKGAPSATIEICNRIWTQTGVTPLTSKEKNVLHQKIEAWASRGYRILAFSYSEGNGLKKELRNQVFVGMVALLDPPRPEAKNALYKAQQAGIRVVMITGDSEKTAETIGTQVGLVQKGDLIISGEQIESYTDEEIIKILPLVKVFARITPHHKKRIVQLYQEAGEVVAVTGDGVNDAIALKQADVGIAMGKVGTDVARETADIVLADDNFATIIEAVDEGRNIVKRLRDAIKYLLTGNLSEGLSLFIGLVIGFPPLLLPIHLLYVNLVSDGVPALALSFAPRNPDVMKERPRKQLTLLTKDDVMYIAVVGILVACVVLNAFGFSSDVLEVQRTVAFGLLSMIQIFIFLHIWHQHSRKSSGENKYPLIFFITLFIPIFFTMLILTVPYLAELFHVRVLF